MNQFSGNLPHEIGNVTVLEQLDLHNNHLTGEIPSELSLEMAGRKKGFRMD